MHLGRLPAARFFDAPQHQTSGSPLKVAKLRDHLHLNPIFSAVIPFFQIYVFLLRAPYLDLVFRLSHQLDVHRNHGPRPIFQAVLGGVIFKDQDGKLTHQLLQQFADIFTTSHGS